MDQKTWLWRKKPTEKTIVVSDKVNLLLKENGEEKLGTDKAVELEISVKNLSEKLSSALSECNAKDDLVTEHAKVAEEAIAGWEKAEAEALSLKQELDEALQERVVAEERIAHLDAALKECMQQLRFVREEQEQRIHDAVLKVSKEFERVRIVLEDKLAEGSKKLSKLGIENTHLTKALHVKENLIDDLSQYQSQAEADFKALMTRLDSMEKENASLKYEVCMLEKELEIRNEERDFNRQSADASHKQHLESGKKIAKLEAECQRLRLLVRKRLPGPAALVKMKNEVEMLGKYPADMRTRKSNPPVTGLMVKDFGADTSPENPSRRINFLTEQLFSMEEENKNLKEALSKKNNELQYSRTMCARTASKLSQFESQLGVLTKDRTTMELTRSFPSSHELSLDSISGDGNEDEPSSAISWASALISELDHFRNGKPRGQSCSTAGISDISLMDDFVEMEKLAIVSVGKPFGSSHNSDESNSFMVSKAESGFNPSNATGMELVPVTDSLSGSVHTNQEIQLKDGSIGKSPSWIQDIVKMILEQNHKTQKNPEEILEEIRSVLVCVNHGEFSNYKKVSRHSEAAEHTHISGYISWRPPNTHPLADSFDGASEINISSKEIGNQQLQSNLNKSICKIVELIEGINQPSLMDYNTPEILSEENGTSLPYKNPATPSGYTVHVFRWKSSELSAVLLQFVQTCNDLLSGKADLEKFARELTSALDWIVNHCFSIRDVSSMRDMIKKKNFDWDDSGCECEIGTGINIPLPDGEKVHVSREQLCFSSTPDAESNLSHMKEFLSILKEENRRLKDELTNMQSSKKGLEGRLQSEYHKSESLMMQFQESEQNIANLQTELEKLKESRGIIEDQIENYILLNEDLDTQLTVARVELNEARQKFSSLEAELEDKSNCCEELEAACLELQLQIESVTKSEIPKYNPNQEEKQLRTDWEITAASEKLAECQETILNLGKQLKALASPREDSFLDKIIPTTPDATANNKTENIKHRSSLLDQMLAEDDAEGEDLNSPKTKEIICSVEPQKLLTLPANDTNFLYGPTVPVETVKAPSSNKKKDKTKTTTADSLAVVPLKKRGGGASLLKKLLSRKRGKSKKASLPIAA
ncbi:filament-like plant protein 7 isoform X2 [Macadamia integrifolia]|uniref:filament-like plant protein 7 isoform X2 n=1 Tax=Macadamia integrifolia TaxID=60698 RepID=UPI001C4FD73A|nr:filament-like plant protein 7 isoform X2 [Macadamia integrifolia]